MRSFVNLVVVLDKFWVMIFMMFSIKLICVGLVCGWGVGDNFVENLNKRMIWN